MKTIITSTGNTLKSAFDKRFGKAKWFCMLDEDTSETTFIENREYEAQQGTCKKAAALIKQLEADKVISGHFGPGATRQLNEAGIQMIIYEKPKSTVQEIINDLI
jgi:predicted Fe-Mo cluster-binding NifX family protein